MKTYLEQREISAGTTWVKSSRSGAAGHCVELAETGDGVALRHSKNKERGAFVFTADEMSTFIEGAKDGEFDHLI